MITISASLGIISGIRNALKMHPKGITKAHRKMFNSLDYGDIKFHVSKEDYGRIERKNSICINIFGYENDLGYPVHVSDQKFEDCMDLLLIKYENSSHNVYIKNFNRFMCNRTNYKNKKHYCLQCFNSRRILIEYKDICLKVYGKQSIKLRDGSIKFRNYSKQ